MTPEPLVEVGRSCVVRLGTKLVTTGAGLAIAAAVVTSVQSGDAEDPMRSQPSDRAGRDGGPTVLWVPEAPPHDQFETPVAGQPPGGGQLLPPASGVYEARPPFLIERIP